MNHEDWVRQEFRELTHSLGFRYTSFEEIETRLDRVRTYMGKQGMQALLVIQKMDFYYLSGTTQDGLLFLPLEGDPLLMIKRELGRAKAESPIKEVVALRSLREIPTLIQTYWNRLPRNLGLEFDVLPVNDYLRFQECFSGLEFMDASPILRETRKIKSPFEIDLMRVAGKIGKKVYQEAKRILREGLTEIEFGGLLEAVAKGHGHEGLLRVRSLNYEAYTWHVLSGPTGGSLASRIHPWVD